MASSTAATATDTLWGSTPISTFMSAYLRSARTSATTIGAGEGHSYYFVLCTHLFRATPHAWHRWDASLEQANPSYGRQEVRE